MRISWYQSLIIYFLQQQHQVFGDILYIIKIRLSCYVFEEMTAITD